MKKSFVIGGFLVLASFSAGTVAANEPAASPAPPAGAMQLLAFIGHWTGAGEMSEPGKDKRTTAVDMNCAETAGGWGIRCDEVITGDGMNYLESDLMGYDAAGGQVRWYMVSNAGEVQAYDAQWEGDSKFLAGHTKKVGGKTISEDITLQWTSPTHIEAKSVVTVDRIEAQSLTMTLQKSGKEKQSP